MGKQQCYLSQTACFSGIGSAICNCDEKLSNPCPMNAQNSLEMKGSGCSADRARGLTLRGIGSNCLSSIASCLIKIYFAFDSSSRNQYALCSMKRHYLLGMRCRSANIGHHARVLQSQLPELLILCGQAACSAPLRPCLVDAPCKGKDRP